MQGQRSQLLLRDETGPSPVVLPFVRQVRICTAICCLAAADISMPAGQTAVAARRVLSDQNAGAQPQNLAVLTQLTMTGCRSRLEETSAWSRAPACRGKQSTLPSQLTLCSQSSWVTRASLFAAETARLQIYTGGDECQVKDTSVRREAELRLACSTNGQPRVQVQEGPECQYTVHLFVPTLCGVEGFGPVRGQGRQVQGAQGMDEDDDLEPHDEL